MFYRTEQLHDEEIYLQLVNTITHQPEKGWLPAYYFEICLLDGTRIGKCDLRIGNNKKTYFGGNIGYHIDKNYRGHQYAAKACRVLFQLARKHSLEFLYISCQPHNIASYRTCEILGGKLIEIADIPTTNEMYQEGKRKVKIYQFHL